jgi:hypothetical protein
MLSDTSPEAEDVLFDLARRTPPWRKVELVGEMYRMVRDLAWSGLQQRYPEATQIELRRRLADLLLGRELAARVYESPPED